MSDRKKFHTGLAMFVASLVLGGISIATYHPHPTQLWMLWPYTAGCVGTMGTLFMVAGANL